MEHLSPQPHYSFGLRALKPVVAHAGEPTEPRTSAANANAIADTADHATDLTVNLSTAASGRLAIGAASGVLYALNATAPTDAMLTPLKLQSYRGRPNTTLDEAVFARLRKLGVRHIQILFSDGWGYCNYHTAPNPPYCDQWPGDNGKWPRIDALIEFVSPRPSERKCTTCV